MKLIKALCAIFWTALGKNRRRFLFFKSPLTPPKGGENKSNKKARTKMLRLADKLLTTLTLPCSDFSTRYARLKNNGGSVYKSRGRSLFVVLAAALATGLALAAFLAEFRVAGTLVFRVQGFAALALLFASHGFGD